MKGKRSLAANIVRKLSFGVVILLAIPAAVCFGVLWLFLGLSDKMIERIEENDRSKNKYNEQEK